MTETDKYTNIMLEFEKLTTKLDKLEKEVAEFKELVFPLQTITHFETQYLIGEQTNWVPPSIKCP